MKKVTNCVQGIISPILANIYLDQFDKYVKQYIGQFDKGKRRQQNPPYVQIRGKIFRLNKKIKVETDESERQQMIETVKALIQERNRYPADVKMDDTVKRMKYQRYADDFLIGIIGSKDDCKQVKEDLKRYLFDHLQLELSEEKTLITNARKPAKFLGYEIYIRDSQETKRDKTGNPIRCFSNKVVLYVTAEVMKKKLLDYEAVQLVSKNGSEIWRPFPRYCMTNLDDLEILGQVNSEIRGFYNYYSIANNSSFVQSFGYIMEYSMYKTYARKHKSSIAKEKTKNCINGVFTISYKNKNGKIINRSFYKDGYNRKKIASHIYVDKLPNTISFTGGRNGLTDRLQAEKCEYCGATEKLEMHHVRKLKDLKGKQDWEKKMIARNRKTLAVCVKCHQKIHAGKLD